MTIEEVAGSQVRRCRETRGWSQAQLGRHVGEILGEPWSRQAVSTAEQGGRRFNIAGLLGLALALDQPVGILLSPPAGTRWIALGDRELSVQALERVAFPVEDLVRELEMALLPTSHVLLRIQDLLKRVRDLKDETDG